MDDDSCVDLVFNFLVAHVTREAPIKVTQRKRSTLRAAPVDDRSALGFKARQRCFVTLVNETFGYVPLVKSQVRLDPVLYKDQVSNLRKKFKKIEQVI